MSNVSTSYAKAQFDAGLIISDEQFYTSDTMTVDEIQEFLNNKVGTDGQCHMEKMPAKFLSISAKCLKDYKMNTNTIEADKYCNKVNGQNGDSSANILYKVSQACNVNVKVLLVLLQKEQGLVTDDHPDLTQYKSAMGYGCPDSASCDSKYYGFFNQVYMSAHQYKIYRSAPQMYRYQANMNNNIKFNPKSSCGTVQVYIKNQATAGLYIYTPYVPNKAALDAGYGIGDACSSYGNRNFFNYFNDWFGNPQSTDISDDNDNIVENITRFTDVPNNHTFAYDIKFLDQTKVTTGYNNTNQFKPSNIVNRGSMAAFMYRLMGSPKFTPPQKPTFKDVPKTHLFYKEIQWLYSRKITTGIDNTNVYAPSKAVSRGSMAAFMYRLMGSPKFTPPQKPTFADVPKTHLFYKEIQWLYKNGITTGYNNSNKFKPSNTVNRGSMAAFLHRIAQKFPNNVGSEVKKILNDEKVLD